MCQETFWNIMRRYTQEKSPLPVGYATRSLLIGSTRNVMRRYTQVKSPLPAGYAMKHSETWSLDTLKRKALSLLDVWRDILKHQAKINTEEKPFACGMCQDTFWNITIEDTYRRKAICLQDVRQDILKLHEKIHTRQKIYACRMCNDTFWNVRQKNTQEKSLLDVRQDLCKPYWPEMSQENVHRRKTICVWDVQRNLCQLDRPEMSCEDTHRRKALCLHDVWMFWNVTINHQMKYLSTTLTETLDLALMFKESSFIILYHKA